MRKRAWICAAAAGAAVAVFVAGTAVADENKEDRAELRMAQRQLHSGDAAERAEGVARLGNLPGPDAVKVIVPAGLIDSAPEVRHAAYAAVAAWKDDPQVCAFLLRTLNKESRAKKRGLSCAVPLVMILLASEPADVQRELAKFLDAFAAAAPDNVALLTAAADELGKLADAAALRSLDRATHLKCFSASFAVRRAVVQAMTEIRLPEAVEALVALLPKTDGEVHGDILRHLTLVSGNFRGDDDNAWSAWWKKNKDGFQFPKGDLKTLPIAEHVRGTASYYGLSIQARRVVFVIDISGSMHGPRLEAAQRELIQTISALPEDTMLNIVAFSERATVWRKTLMPANSRTKQAAQNFVYQLRAGGRTAAYDALEAAFRFDAEAVYFLSDGEPNAGKIPHPAAILAKVTQANRARRVSIYTIGIGADDPHGPLESFMRKLGEDNFGVYRRVEH